jgi:hypothetical protein
MTEREQEYRLEKPSGMFRWRAGCVAEVETQIACEFRQCAEDQRTVFVREKALHPSTNDNIQRANPTRGEF